MKKQFKPDWTVHPGENLAEHLSIENESNSYQTMLILTEFSKKSNINMVELIFIINKKCGISEETAEKLGASTVYSKKMWMNLQRNYEEDLIRLNKWYNRLWRFIKNLCQN